MTVFKSSFASVFDSFLDFRTAHGFKRETHLGNLIKFDKWCLQKSLDETKLSRELVYEWIDDDTASANDSSHRATTIRLLGKYLCAIGEDAYVLPEKYYPKKSRSIPYIFTDEELEKLFETIDILPATKSEPFLNEIAPTLFRLTYTCGLRPNESRELLTENINIDTGEILITHTKRNKERIIVMSDEMRELACKYDRRRKIFGGASAWFFPSATGAALKTETVYSAFNKAWSNANFLDKYPKKVRVYDLRHRFASARLNRWLDDGENIMAMLPFLREYMGHNSISETAYYVHILPENIVKSSAVDWDKFNAMFPEVTV